MRFNNIQYLEKEVVTVSIRNNNATLAILDGAPVFFDTFDNATNWGVDVRTLSTAGGTSPQGFFAGIAKTEKVGGMVVGDVSEAVVYGFTDAIVTRRTRAASTDTWASVASNGAGDEFLFDNVGNGLSRQSTVPNTLGPILVMGAGSQDTLPTRASTYLGTGLADTYRMKVFVRAM